MRSLRTALSKTFAGVPFAGNLLEFLVLQVANSREAGRTKATLYLTEMEREILFHLQLLAGNEPLLVLADNLQHFDEASIHLLCTLMDPNVARTYPFVSSLRLVSAITNGVPFVEPTAEAISSFGAKVWPLDYVPYDQVGAILRALGVKAPLPADVLTYCAEVSGGHLEVLRLIAICMGDDSAQSRWLLSGDEKAESFLEDLIRQRVSGLGQDGQRVIDLLQHLAVAGCIFSIAEMKCLLSEAYSHLAQSVSRAKEMDLLRESDNRISFTHESVQQAFLRRIEQKEPAVHEKFARCIGRLRSGDYASRAAHFESAGNISEAGDMRFLFCLQKLRSGDLLGAAGIDAASETASPDVARFYRGIKEAWSLFRAGDQAKAHEVLEGLSEMHSPLLMAEKDYLFARCAKAGYSTNDRTLIKKLLMRWRDSDPVEFEQWFRLVSMLIILEADDGDLEAAKYTHRILAGKLVERESFDPFAKSARHILDRRTATLFNAEIAEKRCREAVEFFGADSASKVSGAIRNPMQLYLAQSNHSANLVMLGRFQDAAPAAASALSMRSDFPEILFPRPEIPMNNLVLAGFRSGLLSAPEAREALEQALAMTENKADAILLTNNLALMKTLDGALEDGVEDLARISLELPPRGYESYFVTANLICLKYLAGKDVNSRDRWIELQSQMPSNSDSEWLALAKRHELLTPAFDRIEVGDVSSWWNYPINNAPPMVGQVWRFYGWGLLFSDIQFWSEA
jgi:hypothetical protein